MVLDMIFMSRILCAGLRFIYGDFQGTNGLFMSLFVSRVLESGDAIIKAVEYSLLTEFRAFYHKGKYHTTDIIEDQTTLLNISEMLHKTVIF